MGGKLAIGSGPRGSLSHESRLHRAVDRNDHQTVAYLAERKIDLNRIENGYTALNLALYRRNQELVKILLEAGCDVNIGDLVKPLIQVIWFSYVERDLEFIQLILSTGRCDVNIKHGSEEATALHVAAQAKSPVSKRIIELLVMYGADVNSQTSTGSTPLHCAIEGHLEALTSLLDSGKGTVALDLKDIAGRTALIMAVDRGKDDMVSALLERGASVNVVGHDGATPLMKACGLGSVINVEKIINAGGKINMVDKAGMNCLHAAAYNGKRDIVEILLNMGINKNHKDNQGRTPLYLSSSKGHFDVTKILLMSRADHSITNREGKSPLHIACAQGHVDILNLLISSDADINQSDSHNKTPLYAAVYHGRESIVQILLDNGCDVNAQDKRGKSALHIAVSHGEYELAGILVRCGVI